MSIFSKRRLAVLGGGSGVAFVACVAAILLSAGGSPVLSQKPEGVKEGACRSDVAKFCGGIERGEGRIMQCLQENRENLSAECGARLDKREQRRAAFDAACGADVKQHCGDKRGKELRACMKENRAKLSDACKALISKAREKRDGKKGNQEKRRAIAKACRADARKVCKGVKPGDGKLMACLQENRAQLSSACQAVLPVPGDEDPGS
jgi:hypothetical protein